MTRILLWALAIILVVHAIGRILRGIAEGAGWARPPRRASGRPPSPAKSEPMVQDPVCGTYVVQGRALSARGRDGVHYFCSEKCRQAYQAK